MYDRDVTCVNEEALTAVEAWSDCSGPWFSNGQAAIIWFFPDIRVDTDSDMEV